MVTQKRKPVRKRAQPAQAEPQPTVHLEDEGDVTRWLAQASPSIGHVSTAPTEEASVLAQMVRNYQGTRDVRFDGASGVVLMYGYNGLSRLMGGIQHVHVATVDELAAMSDQQIYEAVMQAGVKKR